MRAPLQFVLDFFTGGDPVAPAPAQPPTQVPSSARAPNVAPTPAPTLAPDAAIRLPGSGSDSAQDAALPPVSGFTHPTANRHAQLQGVMVSFRFERSRRKSIGPDQKANAFPV